MCQIPIHSWITTRKQVRRLFAGPGSDMMMDKEGSEAKRRFTTQQKCREPSLQNHMRPLSWPNCHSPRIQCKTRSPKLSVKWNAFSMCFEEKNSFPFHGKIFNPVGNAPPSMSASPAASHPICWGSTLPVKASVTKAGLRLTQTYAFAISMENQMRSGEKWNDQVIHLETLANRSFLQIRCLS